MARWTPSTPAITPPREVSYERHPEHHAAPAPAGTTTSAHRQVALDHGRRTGRGRRAAFRGATRDGVLPARAGQRLARHLVVPVWRPEDGRRPAAGPELT